MSAVVLLVAGVSEASTNRTPRFSVSTTSAIPGDDVVVRIDRASTSHALIRLYLIRQEDVRSVHSRFDPRVNFVGFIAGGSHAQLLFTMPSLQPGRYELAYWCRTCFRRSTGIGVERTKLEIDPPISSGCQATTPNGNAPPVSGAWTGFHGAGRLWVLLPRTGTLEFPTGNGDILFDKML